METPRARDGEQRVAADEWDIDGWQILASEAEKASFAAAKPVYERLVSQFPPIGKFWKSYAEHLARENQDNHEGIKAIYDRAVQAAPTSIELWRSYVTFASSLAIKVPGSKLETDALATYERAISSAGLDLNANPLWSHYIDFLKKHTTVSDSHRRDALRRVYQRAVMTCTLFLPLLLEYRFSDMDQGIVHSRHTHIFPLFAINEKITHPVLRLIVERLCPALLSSRERPFRHTCSFARQQTRAG